MTMGTSSISTTKQRLLQFQNLKYSYRSIGNTVLQDFRCAAVLVPLFYDKEELHVLLTVRSSSMKRHAGDVAFPGGMRDEEDEDEIVTALREAEEEIGLNRTQVDVVCTLLPRVTRYDVIMFPVVGFIPPSFKAVPNGEVDDVFSLPLSRFLSDKKHTGLQFMWKGQPSFTHTFTDPVGENSYTTWGLTASVCVELAVALLQQPTQYIYTDDEPLSPETPFINHEQYLENLIVRLSSKL